MKSFKRTYHQMILKESILTLTSKANLQSKVTLEERGRANLHTEHPEIFQKKTVYQQTIYQVSTI